MILVLLGTHELPFQRLLDEIETLKNSGKIEEEIVVQSGHTDFKSKEMKIIPFINYDELEELYEQASLIITHAGTGSVITGLKKDKRVIAAPRLKQHGEHNDDHQLELAKVFEESGHILIWNDGDDLEEIIQISRQFSPNKFISQKKKMLGLLEDYIDNI
ncbi:PssE/Cps14G family polysaccharide biosynthesis glycosyltransferase [Gracilibacillus salinarum]|uniref:Exopolysaccharide biosynthesis protein n=1 Tax=Gracilibacillus salinarum TaxID=2932255 RepID=A0ABY4GS52_9BACI|nr:PssE/Cps14G family polysaccharide biosynthesis glycosyltransferase [Gracilibacillus salinarum]UOQ87051.1 exopolysaccharide biosynthesis protein [Gracilibacillus salinarum]